MSITNIILALFIFCVIITFHEFGHYSFARLFGVGVKEFAIGFGPKILSKKIGETVYSIRLIPFGGFCAMVGEESMSEEDENYAPEKSFCNKSLIQRFLITFAGPLFNFILAIVIATIYIGMYGNPEPATISSIVENGPVSQQTDMEAGDIIVSINNRHIASYQDVNEYIVTHPNRTYNVVVSHNGELKSYTIIPQYNEETKTYIMGVLINVSNVKENRSIFSILKCGLLEFRYYVRMVFDSFGMLFHGDANVKDMSSVIGIIDVMDTGMTDAKSTGGNAMVLGYCLYMIVLISTNLGIMNLLPLPALDGGRCMIYICEMITKKKMQQKVENAINTAGFVMLMVLMVFLVINDISKIIA